MATPKLILIFFVSLFVVSAKATGLQFEVAHRLGEKVAGNRISSREKLLVKLISKQKLFLNRKSIVLTAVLDGNKIVIPKSSLAKFKGGTARLHVALYSDQSEPAANGKSTYTVSNEQSVTINGH